MKTGVPIQPQAATIYTSVQSAPTPTTSQVVAVPRVRDKKSVFDVHWERRPCFVRDYMWADVESQDLTMALVTETVPPVPEPPQNERLDIVKWRIINSQSHLFHITTPVNVNRLHELLMTHPNWPLIDSICKGLKNGFGHGQ